MTVMTPALAAALKQLRDGYNYPNARVAKVRSVRRPHEEAKIARHFNKFGLRKVKLCAQFEMPTGVTDLKLDQHHFDLLTSLSIPNTLVGISSTVYWGFMSDGRRHGRASAQVGFLVNGATRNGKPQDPIALRRCIQKAGKFLKAGVVGSAVGQLEPINRLGYLPFASKVIAFMDPAACGVYDNNINRLIVVLRSPLVPSLPTNKKGNLRPASIASSTVQLSYARWCRLLQCLARDLNVLGFPYRWQCTERQPQPWRAVDVERALFRLADLTVVRTVRRPGSAGAVETVPATGNSLKAPSTSDIMKELRERIDVHREEIGAAQ